MTSQILVVDDEDMVREMQISALSREGYACHAAQNADEACRILMDQEIDLALIDINMPGRSGVELLKELKQTNPDTAVLMATAVDNLDTAMFCLQVGADDYITKPFNLDRVLESVQQALKNRRKTLESRAYLRDLEEKVQEQSEQLQMSRSMIVQQEKMAAIGQLASGIAHEINNPIGFISSNLRTLSKYLEKITDFIHALEIALKSPNEEKAKAHLENVRRKIKLDFVLEDIRDLLEESLDGTERMQKIVQGLKSFSRVGDAEQKPADVNECLESAINIAWNEIKYKATLKRKLGDLPLTKCYPQPLSQVFMNLLVNAAQAIESQGEIRVKTWCDGENIFASITDTGCGIPEENLGRLFEPFFSTKEAGKGTGLGMSIAAEIMQKHKGAITVDSEVDKGSTFTVKLPILD